MSSTHEIIREAVVEAFNEMLIGSPAAASVELYNFISDFRNTFRYYQTNNIRVKEEVWLSLRKNNTMLHSFMGAATVFGLMTYDHSKEVHAALAASLRVFSGASEIVIDEELSKCPEPTLHYVNLQENLWYQFLVAASFNLRALTVPTAPKGKRPQEKAP